MSLSGQTKSRKNKLVLGDENKCGNHVRCNGGVHILVLQHSSCLTYILGSSCTSHGFVMVILSRGGNRLFFPHRCHPSHPRSISWLAACSSLERTLASMLHQLPCERVHVVDVYGDNNIEQGQKVIDSLNLLPMTAIAINGNANINIFSSSSQAHCK